jgi:hypothetical protein
VNILKSSKSFQMIRRMLRNFGALIIFFAAAALICHMIIPHDHHLAESDTLHEAKCPVPFNSTNHHSGFPFHCHAFNDLASEKVISYYFVRNIQNRDFVPVSSFNIAVINLKISGSRFFDVLEMPVDSFILEFSSLRAPPSIC